MFIKKIFGKKFKKTQVLAPTSPHQPKQERIEDQYIPQQSHDDDYVPPVSFDFLNSTTDNSSNTNNDFGGFEGGTSDGGGASGDY